MKLLSRNNCAITLHAVFTLHVIAFVGMLIVTSDIVIAADQSKVDQVMWEVRQPGFAHNHRNEYFGWSFAVNDVEPDATHIIEFSVGAPGDWFKYAQGHVGRVFQYRFTGRQFEHWRSVDQTSTDANEPGDQFGWQLEGADFNGDGLWDLAVSAPGEKVHGLAGAGQVYVDYGDRALSESSAPTASPSATALLNNANPMLTLSNQRNVDSHAEDRFGYSLVTADFNNDGIEDLLVGVPHANSAMSLNHNVGAVDVFLGSASGLMWIQRLQSPSKIINPGWSFGLALATGNYNGDAYDDVAVLSKFSSTDSPRRTRVSVDIFHGSSGKLQSAQHRQWQPYARVNVNTDIPRVTMSSGPVYSGDIDQIVIGLPDARAQGPGCGYGHVIIFAPEHGGHGREDSLSLQPPCVLPASSLNFEQSDGFGAALAIGDFDGDSVAELMVGAPHSSFSRYFQAGVVYQYSVGGNKSLLLTRIEQFGGRPANGELFGAAMHTIKRMPVASDALLIGAPGESVGGSGPGAGSVYLLKERQK